MTFGFGGLAAGIVDAMPPPPPTRSWRARRTSSIGAGSARRRARLPVAGVRDAGHAQALAEWVPLAEVAADELDLARSDQLTCNPPMTRWHFSLAL